MPAVDAPGWLSWVACRGECELFNREEVERWAQMDPAEIQYNEEGGWCAGLALSPASWAGSRRAQAAGAHC